MHRSAVRQDETVVLPGVARDVCQGVCPARVRATRNMVGTALVTLPTEDEPQVRGAEAAASIAQLSAA